MPNTDLIPFAGNDFIDSREVIEAIDNLTGAIEDEDFLLGTAAEYAAALATLEALAEEVAGYTPAWRWGTTLIADRAFEDYARELANELAGNNPNPTWPFTHIDWEAAAAELKNDYTGIDFLGTTYWVR